jgi:hypothetical protein
MEVLSKPIMMEILTQLHQGSHWFVYAMCDVIPSLCVSRNLYSSKTDYWRQYLRGRNPGLRPFQSVQGNYVELHQVWHLKYLLVMVDH